MAKMTVQETGMMFDDVLNDAKRDWTNGNLTDALDRLTRYSQPVSQYLTAAFASRLLHLDQVTYQRILRDRAIMAHRDGV